MIKYVDCSFDQGYPKIVNADEINDGNDYIINKLYKITNDTAKVLYRNGDNTPANYENAPPRYIAGEILAASKALMNAVIFAIGGHLYPGRVVYSDTDLLFIKFKFYKLLCRKKRLFDGQMLSIIGDLLSQFKNDLGTSLIFESFQTAPKIKGMTLMSATGGLKFEATWKRASAKKYWCELEKAFYWHDSQGELLLLENFCEEHPSAAEILDKKGYDKKGRYSYFEPTPVVEKFKYLNLKSKYIEYGQKKEINWGVHDVVAKDPSGSITWLNQKRVFDFVKTHNPKRMTTETRPFIDVDGIKHFDVFAPFEHVWDTTKVTHKIDRASLCTEACNQNKEIIY